MEKPQNQAADVVSGEGARLHVPRDGATHKEGGTALLSGPRDRAPWGHCTHQPQHFLQADKRMAAANGRRTSPRSHPGRSPGPLPYHRGLLSLGISRGAAESGTGGLALQNEAVLSRQHVSETCPTLLRACEG